MATVNVQRRVASTSFAKRSSAMPSLFVISIPILVTFALISLAAADSIVDEQVLGQHSHNDEQPTQIDDTSSKLNQHPRSVHDLFNRMQRNGNSLAASTSGGSSSSSDDSKSCVIEVQEIRRVPGRCIRLMGGSGACHSNEYLDPMNSDCQ